MRGPHIITIYNRLSEVDRRATFSHAVIAGVRLEERSGAVASMLGRVSTDGVFVMVPMDSTRGYVAPEAFSGTGWTLREGDVIAFGAQDASTPPSPSWVITGIERMERRSGRIVAFEVSAS